MLEPESRRIGKRPHRAPRLSPGRTSAELTVVSTPEYCTVLNTLFAFIRISKLRVSPNEMVRDKRPVDRHRTRQLDRIADAVADTIHRWIGVGSKRRRVEPLCRCPAPLIGCARDAVRPQRTGAPAAISLRRHENIGVRIAARGKGEVARNREAVHDLRPEPALVQEGAVRSKRWLRCTKLPFSECRRSKLELLSSAPRFWSFCAMELPLPPTRRCVVDRMGVGIRRLQRDALLHPLRAG